MTDTKNLIMGTLLQAVGRFRVEGAGSNLATHGSLTSLHLTGSDEIWHIEPEAFPPRWADVTVREVNRLAHAHDGWDSYGARRLNPGAALQALRLLSDLGYDGPAPWVSPTGDGGLHMEWNILGFGIEIDIEPSRTVFVLTDDQGAVEEWEAPFHGGDRLRVALDALTDRAAAAVR